MTSDKSTSLELRLNALLGDPWQNMGSPTSGWGIGGHAQFRRSADGCLIVAFKDLTVGTATNGTTVWSAANGLPPGYAPQNSHRLVAYCDRTAMWSTANITEMSALEFQTDGSVTCLGIGGTATRLDLYGIFPIDN